MEPIQFEVGKIYRSKDGGLYRLRNIEEPDEIMTMYHGGRSVLNFIPLHIVNGELISLDNLPQYKWQCGNSDYTRPRTYDNDILPGEVTMEEIFPPPFVQIAFVKPTPAQRALEL